jgi:hypothetical protein
VGAAATELLILRQCQRLMADFATRTGLEGEARPRRYLWTDAFAVCNFLGLWRETGERRWLDLALRLVEQVHHTLGRHRPDDLRQGWIGGLDETEGERHPTRGGLRIGKPLPERGPREPYDPQLEWDRDGQYFHYLTQWMHALHRASRETGDAAFHRWARELAAAAHAAFTYRPPEGDPPRMVWKTSIDLSRPLVPAMGQHDPLDALVTYLELETGAPRGGEGSDAGPGLGREIEEAAAMCAGGRWATDDPLGIGGLLLDAARLGPIALRDGGGLLPLLRRLLADAAASLGAFARTPLLSLPAAQRLAFRELGLAIGLRGAAGATPRLAGRADLAPAVAALEPYLPLAARITGFWAEPANQRGRTWSDHRDINEVMLATSLAPAGYLGS